jgi:hypothetical protein
MIFTTINNNEVLKMLKILSTLLFTCLTATPAFADMVQVPADRDASLIEDAEGDAANGMGPAFRAGHTNQQLFGVRRALVHFDVAGALPEDAIIDRVFLTLYENSNNAEPSDVSLHRVLADWGEGDSFSNGGGGAAAVEGDTTWLHTFYEYDYWVHQGGHFVPQASATETVLGNDFYDFQSTNHMVNNVRHWLNDPERNFGWVIIGDEYIRGSVKRFASRNSGNSDQHPVLTVEYHMPGE